MSAKVPDSHPGGGSVESFLDHLSSVPQRRSDGALGRLMFAMDATASRQPTWDRAVSIQAEMFKAAEQVGGLEIQLVFYRGFGEFKASPWLADPTRLAHMMSKVSCLAGGTQIRKVLRHAVNQAEAGSVNALVFVGDCLEEDVDALGDVAGKLGVLGVPAFLFREGADPVAAFGFDQVAKLTGGASLEFDPNSPRMLADLLKAVAIFAAGGHRALDDLAKVEGGEMLRLTRSFGGSRD
ncbi:hypothetical protein [Magnetospira sp. QH-2]|uniref:hypothetical protein n=1 Tax=Magnetospira sp. (strain QH-2) TaxID=1288970 RepID=UPI0003E80E2B|nr:hypothetical protein [Magnetospira sp. QH-2]CCQ73448.1 Conserved protein of unknown function [Magnetospira sp. QH-2]